MMWRGKGKGCAVTAKGSLPPTKSFPCSTSMRHLSLQKCAWNSPASLHPVSELRLISSTSHPISTLLTTLRRTYLFHQTPKECKERRITLMYPKQLRARLYTTLLR